MLSIFASTFLAFSVTPEQLEHANPCHDAPIADVLTNVACEGAQVQSGANVTIGAVGLMATELNPIPLPLKDSGACAVNVHWHLGAEHFNAGTYDVDGDAWMAANAVTRRRKICKEDTAVRHFCPGFDATDAKYTTPYAWEHCKDSMHVGYTYEFHWPHSNLGHCGDAWQYQV